MLRGARSRAAVIACVATIASACSRQDDRGRGVMVEIMNDGTLVVDELDVTVASADRRTVFFEHTYRLPADATLPNTLAIVGDGDAAAPIALAVSAYRIEGGARVALDRRDLLIDGIPTTGYRALPLYLGVSCSCHVALDADGRAQSNCAVGSTCAPATGECGSSMIDASSALAPYEPGAELRASAPYRAGGVCVPPPCVDEPSQATCAGKCGTVTNNCGKVVTCPKESPETTCAGRCGRIMNNCGLVVVCAQCPPKVVASAALGNAPGCVAVNAVTNKIYVVNAASDSVTLVDGASNGATVIPVGRGPATVSVNTATNKIYVTNYGSSVSPDQTVTEIDGATNATTTIGVDPNPYSIAIDDVRNRIWIGHYGFSGHTVSKIDGLTRSVKSIDLVTEQPEAMVVNRATNVVYTSHVDGTLARVDGSDDSVTHFGAGFRGSSLVVNEASNMLYLSRFFAGPSSNLAGGKKLSFFTADLTMTDVAVGVAPSGLALHQRLNRIFVANFLSNEVSVVDAGSRSVIATIPVGKKPDAMAIDEAADLVFVIDAESHDVAAIDAVTYEVTHVAVPQVPRQLAVNPVTRRAYVASGIDDAAGTLTTIQY